VSYEVVFRSTNPLAFPSSGPAPVAAWHHDSYHAGRASAEARASQLILSGLQVRIREVS
jgi:hypothetical protein